MTCFAARPRIARIERCGGLCGSGFFRRMGVHPLERSRTETSSGRAVVADPVLDEMFEPRGRGLSFTLSLLIHTTVFVLLGLLWHGDTGGALEEPDRGVGIAMVRTVGNSTEYFSGDSGAASSVAPSAATGDRLEAFPGQQAPPVDLAGVLPRGGGGNPNATGSGLEGATGLLEGGSSTNRGGIGQGRSQTYVFGLAGVGNKFVYVFDRSASMAGYQGRPLSAAKREMRRSIESLERSNQFQIIFYNDRTSVFNPDHPRPPRLLWGDDSTKSSADRYIQSITADGGTRHLAALKLALGMSPDVIFFLTDADDPQLTTQELAEVQKWNYAASQIHSIQFGAGPDPGGDNFLKRLARQNRGKHTYVDVTALPSDKEAANAESRRD